MSIRGVASLKIISSRELTEPFTAPGLPPTFWFLFGALCGAAVFTFLAV